MKREIIEKPEFTVVGIEFRSSRSIEEASVTIGAGWQRFFDENIVERIPNKIEPGVLIGLYSNCRTEHEVTFAVTIGALVEHARSFPEFLTARTVPAAKYAVFTTDTGPVAEVVGNAWDKINAMSDEELGGKRTLLYDFEIYDESSGGPDSATVKIYVGID